MRTWGRQEADIKILEILNQFKYLRGKTILIKTGFKNTKRGYERLSELQRMGYVEAQKYIRPVNIGSNSKPIIIPKKVAAIYSLTAKGIQVLKEIHGEFVLFSSLLYIQIPLYLKMLTIIQNIEVLLKVFSGKYGNCKANCF